MSTVKATQRHRAVAVSSTLGDDALLFHRMSGGETLGNLFEYRLSLLSENHAVAFDKVLGENMTVRLEGEHGTRYFNGYVAEFSQAGTLGDYSVYQATLRPWLWFLTCTSDCRIFQDKTVPEIVSQVFRDHGFVDFNEHLSGDYRRRDYCVQYRETDFQFISRLMEQEGIYYYFKHENGKHLLVLADSFSAHDAVKGYATVPYYPPGGNNRREREHLYEWAVGKQVRPGAVSLEDFDFKVPRKELGSRLAISRAHAASGFEIFDYPGGYEKIDDGDHYVRARIEELQAQHEILSGECNAQGLAAGALFKLEYHPRDDQNRQYLVTGAHYELKGNTYLTGLDEGHYYVCRISAIPAQQTYRPPRTTPKPAVKGPQTALVVGKQGEEIWTDEYGRVKVQFHWDRYGKADENSSCWIRVAQMWAGKRWGAMYLPRVGQEVIVEFLEGDPDTPIVTGRVYNGASMPPYGLPERKTISTFKSNSSKGGGNFNEIRFEDKKDEEQLFFHAARNQDVRVKNDCFEWIGQNRHLIVKKDQFEHVEHNRHETVDHDHFESIKNDRNLKVGGKQAVAVEGSHSFQVTGNVIEVFQADQSTQVTGNCFIKAQGLVIEAVSGITLKCGGNTLVLDSAGITLKGNLLTLDGDLVKIASGPGSPPQSGKAGTAVSPAAPQAAEEADKADPGEMDEVKSKQRATKSGKYGSVQVKPFVPAIPDGGYKGYFQKNPGNPSSVAQPANAYQPISTSSGNAYQPASTAPGSGYQLLTSATDPVTKNTVVTDPAQLHWIEIELLDEADQPVPSERYEITMPDGSVKQGTLDENGFARVEGIKDPGQCKISFSELDQQAWEFTQSLGPRPQ